jgi:signal transduction histidine kinase
MSIEQTDAGVARHHSKAVTGIQLLYCSPALLVAVIAVCDFFSDAIGMAILTHFQLQSPFNHIFDSLLLVVLLFPTLIFLVFRPMELYLAKCKHAEEDLVAERNKLMGILNAIPAGACIINRSKRIEYTNTALSKEFGPVEGRSCYEYFQGWPEICANCRLMEVLGGKSITWESMSEKTGKTYEFFETPLQNSDGTVSKLTLVHNITTRKEVENELRASRQLLRSLSVHQQRVREEERTSVSREIHDELGQLLATLQLEVSSLAEEYHDHRHLTEKITGMEQLLSGTIKTVQRISTQLRPAILDELGLAEAIEWLANEFRSRTGIACTPDILLPANNLNKDVATAVFRICQEALTNVIRHSGATRVAISLETRHGCIVLAVSDNGCGIASEKLRNGQSLGITGMRERAYAMGGRMRICRSSQEGTTVIARIPSVPMEKTHVKHG